LQDAEKRILLGDGPWATGKKLWLFSHCPFAIAHQARLFQRPAVRGLAVGGAPLANSLLKEEQT
jgi:hypothetical protein